MVKGSKRFCYGGVQVTILLRELFKYGTFIFFFSAFWKIMLYWLKIQSFYPMFIKTECIWEESSCLAMAIRLSFPRPVHWRQVKLGGSSLSNRPQQVQWSVVKNVTFRNVPTGRYVSGRVGMFPFLQNLPTPKIRGYVWKRNFFLQQTPVWLISSSNWILDIPSFEPFY